MKLTIECSCGNKVEVEGNVITCLWEQDFNCFVADGEEYIVIECDECNKQEKVRILLE